LLNTFEQLRPADILELPPRKQKFVKNMQQNPATVCDALSFVLDRIKAPEWAEVLLFIDQFEELFTVAKKEAIAPFCRMLSLIAEHPRLRVVVTIRHDFVHRAVEIPELAELLNRGSYYLAAPTTRALELMIKRPAEAAGLVFDPGLDSQILRDTGSEAGSLALMAYLLDELYNLAKGDKSLSFARYEALGRVEGAIGKRAEETFKKLAGSEAAKEQLLGRVFHKLVEVDERGTATRQRTPQNRFDPEELTLVEAFTKARLLVKDAQMVEVVHEALFRSWKTLKEWISGAQEDLILLRQVKNSTEEWQRKGEPDFLRWPQERLDLVEIMRERLKPELSESELRFIKSERDRLLAELDNLKTNHERRRDIGDRLSIIGDTRPGVGVGNSGMPEIVWLPVAEGGKITIEKETFNVQPFYISKYLITYAQFEAFVKAGDGFDNPQWWAGMLQEYQQQKLGNQRTKSKNNPRDSVSWYQSVAFTRWLNHRMKGWQSPSPDGSGTPWIIGQNAQVRLPLEWEWQCAAQGGSQQREYPWGKWQEGYANTAESGLSRAIAVGMYPQGVTNCGAMDMSGNLYEWCLNKHSKPKENQVDASRERRVLRGGSYYYDPDLASCVSRANYNPHGDLGHYGFRVVVVSALSRPSDL